MRILKEEIISIFKKQEKNYIYISSSLKNLEYYYYILRKEKYNVNYFKLNSNTKRELLDINIRLIETLKKKNQIILVDFSLALSLFFNKTSNFLLEINKEYSLNKIEEKLLEFSYEKNYLVTEQGQYSRRGDIIDIFTPNMDNPVRLDFFDIELEKIKVFDTEDQKSFDLMDKIYIYSNNTYGKEVLITELNDKKVDIFVENEEILKYHLESMILLSEEKEELLKKKYENLLKNAIKLEVQISKKRNYQNEIDEEKHEKSKKGMKYQSISDIKKGDFVIHIEYGIGKYEGLETLDGKEYFLIKYADDGELFVPIEKIHRIEKYINVSGEEPKIYTLGRKGFKKKREKHKEDIEKLAKELILLQAKREEKTGIIFNEDTVWQKEFEEKFEHLETLDQLKAIREVKMDMESPKIMDRIICGDVGYGKTEVAMRAAFKAIESGYQVAMLAPTTILANQHYERFKKRFKDYPINIASYSRLSKGTKQLDGLVTNDIDLIIGTHKLLSDKVVFNNLGLLIIDEEQKFGVKDKEKIKQKKVDVDVLTLTATPIPRTLNLALLGIRDISIIATPPTQKLPIKTEVFENISDKKLKDIILHEIARDGQVFFVSNDVKGMPKKTEYLKSILPKFIGIEYIHSKLSAKTIKDKIKDFEEGKFHILVASTIIENGIDISNANTIIIDDFNKLGLSQIYQLRGRVGRAKRQGYCYLLKKKNISEKGKLKEESIERIKDMDFGAYVISMEDMNIRGAGEILGDKQHGAIESFGYDFYIKLLNEEIKKLKGEYKEVRDVNIDIKNKGFIEETYIKEEERLRIYRRIVGFSEIQELNELEEELKDRFGPIPKQTKNFLEYIKIKLIAQKNDIISIKEENSKLLVTYFKNSQNVVELDKKEFFRRFL